MAPKAKAKAKGAMRRPAGLRQGRRRPAIREEGDGGEAEVRAVEKLKDVDPRNLVQLGSIHLSDALYYGRQVQVAGKLQGVREEDGEWFTDMVVSGTKDDELLRELTGDPKRRLSVHLCGNGCTGVLTDPKLIHGRTYEKVDTAKVPWFTNLVQVAGGALSEDEMAKLREEQRVRERERSPRQREREADGGRKDLKEKKRKRRKEAEGEGRREDSPRGGGAELEIGQVELKVVYRGTGIDPNPKRRKKILKKARKLSGRKKKKKRTSSSATGGSSSSSSTSSSSAIGGSARIFEEESRLGQIWKKCPGALTAGALQEGRSNLMSQADTLWNIAEGELPPIFTQYVRQQIIGPRSVSPAIHQELLTVGQALDHLLLGKIAGCADILSQRLKSLESLVRGNHYSVGRQLELIKADTLGIAANSEALAAAKRAREEDKLRSLVASPMGSKGNEPYYAGKAGRKGKDGKSTGKGRSEEGGKGKGGEGRKDEPKGSATKR